MAGYSLEKSDAYRMSATRILLPVNVKPGLSHAHFAHVLLKTISTGRSHTLNWDAKAAPSNICAQISDWLFCWPPAFRLFTLKTLRIDSFRPTRRTANGTPHGLR